MQTTIFDVLYPKYKITKPIRLIEFFAGYGSQALALKYLGVPFEHWKICEWAVKSIQAYKDIHYSKGGWEYACVNYDNIPDYDYAEYLFKKGISQNYNEPMTLEQIKRLGKEKQKEIIANIQITHNLVNIQQVHGKDLEIIDTDKYEYIMTYSFPCQDLSLAGKGKGMSDTTTRSGMLWEVERILTECHELGNMPQILLMENVPQVHSEDNLPDFNKWKDRLEELGYKNYFQDLIATDYGIPQTRNRCFMISLLGDYSYTFPKPMPLKLKLKDMLEDNVGEKYYLSDKMINYVCSRMPTGNNKITTGINMGNRESLKNAGTLTTGEGGKPSSNFIIENNDFDYSRVKGKILIKNATSKGYLEAIDGDGIDISSRMEYYRGNVQKDKIQTLTTSGGNDRGVVINSNIKNINYENGIFSTLGTNCGSSTSAGGGIVVKNDLKIRKLTPKECFRLMGVKDEDYDKVKVNQSDSSLYHLAGDSIVVNVLMAIFKEML